MLKSIVSSKTFMVFVFLFVRTSSIYKVPLTIHSNTTQSRTLVNQNSNLAVDGYRHTCSVAGGVNKTEPPWWRVMLWKKFLIHKIIIYFDRFQGIAYRRYLNAYISNNESNPEESWCKQRFGVIIEGDAFVIVCNEPILGKIVTLKIHGSDIQSFVVCEVNVFAIGLITISENKHTMQSHLKTIDTIIGGLAVDGDKNTCSKIYAIGDPAWWFVELGDNFYINRIIIYFQQNTTVTKEQMYLKVLVSNSVQANHHNICVDIGEITFNKLQNFINESCVEPNPFGKYVKIQKYNGKKINAMMLCEVAVIAKFSIVEPATACKDFELVCRVFSDVLCIPKWKLCNKVKDCPTGIDETNCTCQKDEFKCKDGLCIPKEWLCDDEKDCLLGEDEKQNCVTHCKRKGDFACEKTTQCIDRDKRCDGNTDCSDYSDEHRCFEMVVHGGAEEKVLLLATYHGQHEFYVCADNWNVLLTHSMCLYLTGRMLGEYYVYKPKWINKKQVIALREKNPFENNIPNMKNFQESNNCTSLVEILCKSLGVDYTRYQCGTRGKINEELGPYIVNGDAAKLGAWPWQVQILVGGKQLCGGSILKDRWILTAAHCSRDIEVHDLIVKVGSNKFDDPDVEGIGVTHIVNHPEFEGVKNDIGLLRLSKRIQFSDNVNPICLPRNKYVINNLKYFRYCVATGFGRVDRDGSHPLYLMQGRMNIMPDDVCIKNLATIGEDTEAGYMAALKDNHLMCAGSVPTRDGINPCWGDSGGPFVCKDPHGIWYQVAMIELFEIGRNKEECTNSLLTKVDYHLDFISHVLDNQHKFNKMARVFQTYNGISSYLIILLQYLSVS